MFYDFNSCYIPIIPLGTNVWTDPKDGIQSSIMNFFEKPNEIVVASKVVLKKKKRKEWSSIILHTSYM